MAADNAVKITTSGREYHSRTSVLFAKIFENDPVINYMLSSLSPTKKQEYMPEYFSTLLTAAYLNNAVFQEANEFSSMAVWMPPGKSVDNWKTNIQAGFLPVLWKLGIAGVKRMLVEYMGTSETLKRKHLQARGVREYYYLFFVGTVKDQEGKGLATTLIRRWQDENCVNQGVPIWLEATTAKSRDVYLKCGFEVVGSFRLGRRTHNPQGRSEDQGHGVEVWAMLWMPRKK